jgi:hypothetical protein
MSCYLSAAWFVAFPAAFCRVAWEHQGQIPSGMLYFLDQLILKACHIARVFIIVITAIQIRCPA